METDLIWLDARALHRGYRDRTFSPLEVTRACLDRIDALNDSFDAFCLVDNERAINQAKASTDRWMRGSEIGPGDGIPTTIKDLLIAKDWPCRRGSLTTNQLNCQDDAPAVAHLRRAGAVFLGKTTTPECGWKALTDNPLGHTARNPHNRDKTTGGSSGGAAAAAALGMGVWHVGTDGGGSIRIPSSFCGIFGLKPTFGSVPAWPLSPFGTVSHVGPMTRNVDDAVAMLEVISQPDLRDWHQLPPLSHTYRDGLDDGIQGWSIAVSRDLGQLHVDDEVVDAFERAVALLADLGAIVQWIDPPVPPCEELFNRHWYAGAANLLATIDEHDHHNIDPGLREIAAQGECLSAWELRQASLDRGTLGAAMQSFFASYDLLLTPSTTLTAFDVSHEVPPGSQLKRWIGWAGMSYPFNLTQQPAASLPCGQTVDGMPVGLQLVGAKYRDGAVLRAAKALEHAGLAFKQPRL